MAASTVTAALRVHGLSAGYGTRRVLSELSLEIAPGQWFALLGPNGAGKTTLLHCIGGLLAPQSGQIVVSGISLADRALEAKRLLGFGCAPERLPDLLTGRQCLEIHAAAKQLRALDETNSSLIRAFEFEPLLDRFVDTYSTGSRQKLAVLLAGRLVHTWQAQELAALRGSSAGLEGAVAAVAATAIATSSPAA
jgi:ABC-2 type transport system ATP-binding protein